MAFINLLIMVYDGLVWAMFKANLAIGADFFIYYYPVLLITFYSFVGTILNTWSRIAVSTAISH